MLQAAFNYVNLWDCGGCTCHAFESDKNEAVLLAEASNAFNLDKLSSTISKGVALLLLPSYIQSPEGTTQGDTLTMPMYDLATIF